MLYCSKCRCMHGNSAFGTQQRRRPAAVRQCKAPVAPPTIVRRGNVLYVTGGSSYCSHGDWADAVEFGRSRYWASETFDNRYQSGVRSTWHGTTHYGYDPWYDSD
jgi:hypothetical protein